MKQTGPILLLLMATVSIWSLINAWQANDPRSPGLSITPQRLLASGASSWIAQGYWLSHIESYHSPPNVDVTQRNLQLILNYSPRNVFYRINAAGILAYDLTATPEITSKEADTLIIAAEHLLTTGIALSPDLAPNYHYELGKLYLLKKKDPSTARKYFELAAAPPCR